MEAMWKLKKTSSLVSKLDANPWRLMEVSVLHSGVIFSYNRENLMVWNDH